MGENFIIIAQQVLVLFILIAVGFICGKKKIITDFSARHMTDIVLYVVTPCVMISAFQREFSFELLSGLIICVACSALIFAVSILICNLIFHDKDESRKAVIRFATIYSNCAFMSLPLQKAILGDDGWFYGSIFVAVFNIFVWTHGLVSMSGDKKQLSFKKSKPLRPWMVRVSARSSFLRAVHSVVSIVTIQKPGRVARGSPWMWRNSSLWSNATSLIMVNWVV